MNWGFNLLTPRHSNPAWHQRTLLIHATRSFSKHSNLFYTQYFTALFDTRYDTFSHSAVADCHVYYYFVQSCWHSFSRIICDWCQDRTWNLGTDETSSLTSDFTYAIDVTVPWSVCLSVTFLHCAQTAEDIDTISSAYDRPISLPDLVKILLTLVYRFPSNCAPNTTPLLIWASAIFDGKLRPNGYMVSDSAMVTMESI